MDALNFVYWLQGYFELSGGDMLTPDQVQVIKDHIGLVLEKKTPKIIINPPALQPCLSDDIPICSSAPHISFDDREPLNYQWGTGSLTWDEKKEEFVISGEKAAEDIFPPTINMGQLRTGEGKPPASC